MTKHVNPFGIQPKNSNPKKLTNCFYNTSDIIKQSIMNTEIRIRQRFAFYFICESESREY